MDIHVVQPYEIQMTIKDVTKEFRNLKNEIIGGEKNQRSLQKQLKVTEWDDLWILVEDGYYLIQMVVKDKDEREITITENLMFNSIIDDSLFTIVS